MIAAARKCGCPIKSDFRTCPNFENDFLATKDSDKCICLRPNEPGYQKLNGTCDICCECNKENENFEEEKSRVVSEIVEKGLPYKEIEVTFNNNRMIIRVQKDSTTREEWEPPCDCNEDTKKPISKQTQNKNQNMKNVVFRKVDPNQCSENRTITVYPQADTDVHQELNSNKNQEGNEIDSGKDVKKIGSSETDKKSYHQQKGIRSIDLEENPNIFLLRIKKKCENGDGKYNIDLEFRTPRPWGPKPIIEKPPPPPPEPAPEIESEDKKDKVKKSKKGKKGKKGKK